jgi:hypothetical protein
MNVCYMHRSFYGSSIYVIHRIMHAIFTKSIHLFIHSFMTYVCRPVLVVEALHALCSPLAVVATRQATSLTVMHQLGLGTGIGPGEGGGFDTPTVSPRRTTTSDETPFTRRSRTSFSETAAVLASHGAGEVHELAVKAEVRANAVCSGGQVGEL